VVAIEEMVTDTLRVAVPQSRVISLDSYSPGQPPRYFDVSAVPIHRPLGTAEEVVLVFHDISRMKQLEDVRREFVANVSHELRTPLSIFRGYLETLLDNPEMPPREVNRILGIMRKHSLRLNALVDDLLTLARLESRKIILEPAVIHLEPFVRQLVADFQSKLDEKRLALTISIPSDLPFLEADPFRLEQVFYNLLDNSIQYSNPGTSLSITARPKDKNIHIQIADQGIGIPPSDVPHIFERFYRVDKARSREAGGTGLGLSIVKHIIQMHQGRVEAMSELGTGTTISIYLPLKVIP
jgi:two-component system phosphate regulon sensor histidine kinase PhoR